LDTIGGKKNGLCRRDLLREFKGISKARSSQQRTPACRGEYQQTQDAGGLRIAGEAGLAHQLAIVAGGTCAAGSLASLRGAALDSLEEDRDAEGVGATVAIGAGGARPMPTRDVSFFYKEPHHSSRGEALAQTKRL